MTDKIENAFRLAPGTLVKCDPYPVIASEQKPVGYLWKWSNGILDDDHPKSGWNYSLEYPEMHPSNVNNIEVIKAFTTPPNTADIEQRVAEACAKYVAQSNSPEHRVELATGLREGKWREYL